MDMNDYENSRMIELLKNPVSQRRHHRVEGLPGNFKSRHTCCNCHKKRFEENMIPTGSVRENNWKAWLLWRCKECEF